MATPITSIDSANIVASTSYNTYNVTGSLVGQTDVDYLLAAKFSFTGSLLADGTVGFSHGVLTAPTGSGIVYTATSVTDFDFYLNGIRIDDSQVVSFFGGIPNINATASFDLGFPLRSDDIVIAKGKFKVP